MVSIPAQPYDYEFANLSNVALIIIDMQRDFLEPGGFGEALGNDVRRLRSIVPVLEQLLITFRVLNLPIIYTIEGHKSDLSDCPPTKINRGNSQLRIGDIGPLGRILVLGEPGNNIIPELAPLPGEIIINKPGKGAFYNTKLQDKLSKQEITHLIFTGVTTEVCVQTTMREANDRGFECLLIEDATESYFPEFKQATIKMIHSQGGIVGWTTKAEKVLQAMQNFSLSSK